MAVMGILMILMLVLILTTDIAIGIYVWSDARKRNMSAASWTLLAILLPCFIGLAIYLVARYGHSKLHCPACGESVRETFAVCPHCGAELKLRCPACQTPVEPDWKICPQCAAPLPERTPPVVEKKEMGLGWLLVVCVLLPVAIIALLLAIDTAPYGYNGSSTAITGTTLSEWQTDETDSWILGEEPVQAWLEDCALTETPGVQVLWQRLYCGEGKTEYQKQVCYLYVTGYSETELDTDTEVGFLGDVRLEVELTGRRDNEAEPMLYYAQVRADKASGDEPKVYLNGELQRGCTEEAEAILPSVFDSAAPIK